MSNSRPWYIAWPHIPMRPCFEQKYRETTYAVDLCQIIYSGRKRFEWHIGTAANEKAAPIKGIEVENPVVL